MPSDLPSASSASVPASVSKKEAGATANAREPMPRSRATAGSSQELGPGTVVLDDRAIVRSLTRIAHEIVERHDDLSQLYLVAIPNGGVPLGRILQENLEAISGIVLPVGILDTTLYRDDLTRKGVRPPLRVTEMPSSVDDRVVLIVEDVVSTGRTIRAAMDAMIDFGRPTGVQVVALVDRGHRELPIKIDYVGKNIPTSAGDKVKFRSVAKHDGTGEAGQLEAPFEVVLMASRESQDLAEDSGEANR